MDDSRFDALTRTVGSRRTVLSLDPADEVAAHNPVPDCHIIDVPERRRACLRRARRHHRQQHTCRPQSPAVTCGGRCGTARVNNCDKKVSCACPAGKACLGNGSCVEACGLDFSTFPFNRQLPARVQLPSHGGRSELLRQHKRCNLLGLYSGLREYRTVPSGAVLPAIDVLCLRPWALRIRLRYL